MLRAPNAGLGSRQTLLRRGAGFPAAAGSRPGRLAGGEQTTRGVDGAGDEFARAFAQVRVGLHEAVAVVVRNLIGSRANWQHKPRRNRVVGCGAAVELDRERFMVEPVLKPQNGFAMPPCET